MPYRASFQVKADPEPGAAAELRRRVQRVRVASVTACTAPVAAVTLALGVVLSGASLDMWSIGVRALAVFGSLAVVGSFLGGLFLSAGVIRWRLDGWLDQVSTDHGVPRRNLVKYTTPWR